MFINFFILKIKDVLTDRIKKVLNGTHDTNTEPSVQMLISCMILPKNANGCSTTSVDVAWNYIQKIQSTSSLTNG